MFLYKKIYLKRYMYMGTYSIGSSLEKCSFDANGNENFTSVVIK